MYRRLPIKCLTSENMSTQKSFVLLGSSSGIALPACSTITSPSTGTPAALMLRFVSDELARETRRSVLRDVEIT